MIEDHLDKILDEDAADVAKAVADARAKRGSGDDPTITEQEIRADERERIARFVEEGYIRQFVRPWREDLSAAIRSFGATPSALAEARSLVESIAREWDGCMAPMFDPAGTPMGVVDVGAAIRAAGVK